MRRYLIVANQTLGGDTLVQAVRERALQEPAEVWVLVPATRPSSFVTRHGPIAGQEQAANSGETFAQRQLDVELERLHAAGVEADGEVGDEDPFQAIVATLARRQFDEILLSTLPTGRSGWLRQDLPSRVRKQTSTPVTTSLPACRRRPAFAPAPARRFPRWKNGRANGVVLDALTLGHLASRRMVVANAPDLVLDPRRAGVDFGPRRSCRR